MKRELIGFSFCLILLFISCSDNQENEVIPAPELNTIKIEKPVYDSLAIEITEEAFVDLQPYFKHQNIPLALSFLDSAISIDPAYHEAKAGKLNLLLYSDSVAARNYFFELVNADPLFHFNPMMKGFLYEFYGFREKADSLYFGTKEYYLTVQTDTMNNTEEIIFLNELVIVYYALDELSKADSIQNVINNEFTVEFHDYAFLKDFKGSRDEAMNEFFDQFREQDIYDSPSETLDGPIDIWGNQ